MSLLKRIQTSAIYLFIGKQEAKHRTLIESVLAPVVVLGFPRSGTSLVAQLVHAAGHSFGESKEDLKPDVRNLKGYFEYKPIFHLSRAFLREAGTKSDLDSISHGFRARGFLNRLRRAQTRSAMISTLNYLMTKGKFGLKLFPRFYYFWKLYLPEKTKIVAVYREPTEVTRSFMAAWPGGAYTADQVYTLWTEHNRDLLFHIANQSDFFLLKYEDLLATTTRSHVLKALASFLDTSEKTFDTIIDPILNHSSKSSSQVSLSLDIRVSETLKTLDTYRSYSI